MSRPKDWVLYFLSSYQMIYKKLNIYYFYIVLNLSACSLSPDYFPMVQKDDVLQSSVDLAPDGHLWRLKYDNGGLSVDVSSIQSKSFTDFICTNHGRQILVAWDEEPQLIIIDLLRYILVMYTIIEDGQNATYFSVLRDDGKQLSAPVYHNNQTGQAPLYLDLMTEDSIGDIRIIWYGSGDNDQSLCNLK